LHEVVHDTVGLRVVVPVLELKPSAALARTLAARSPGAFLRRPFTPLIRAAALQTT